MQKLMGPSGRPSVGVDLEADSVRAPEVEEERKESSPSMSFMNRLRALLS